MLGNEGLAIASMLGNEGLAIASMLGNEGLAIASPSLPNIRRTPNQLHSQQRIPTQHDMLPQHQVYRNELNCECYNITLARRNIAS
jgi:hypothetical protein